MQFGERVVMFTLGNIPMIGNLSTGFTVGLTSMGAQLCQRILDGSMSVEEAREVDRDLTKLLQDEGFFEKELASDKLSLAYLHITQRCNLRCRGCYSYIERRNEREDPSLEQLEVALQRIACHGLETVIISGGEPFLRSDLAQIVRYAKKVGVQTVIVATNGTCIDEYSLREMVPYVDRIAVSFDGCSEQSRARVRGGSQFSRLCDAVRTIQSQGIAAHMTSTIYAGSVNDLARYRDLAADLGVTLNYSLLSCEYGKGNDDLIPDDDELSQLADSLLALGGSLCDIEAPTELNISVGLGCGAGVKEISVDVDGQVYPCHMLHRDEYAFGNIFAEELDAVMSVETAKAFRQLYIEGVQGCLGCRHGYLCSGGCRARSLFRYGDLHSKDAYCSMLLQYYDGLATRLESFTKTETDKLS